MDLYDENSPTLPLTSGFRVIPKNAPDLTEYFERVKLNLCQKILELDLRETKPFDATNWVMALATDPDRPEKAREIITLIAHDEKGKILCMLRFLGLALIHHETGFDKDGAEDVMGDGYSDTVVHEIHLQFDSVERLENCKS